MKNISLKLKKPLKQTNYMTEARALLKPSVYRTIKLIVKKVQESNFDLPHLIDSNETLKLNVPISEIKAWYPNRLYERDLQEAVKWLNDIPVNYETDAGWVITRLIGEGSFSSSEGLNIFINPGALPLYHVKSNEFTLFDFSASMLISKKASLFFYDKCCMWRRARKFEYTPEELKTAMNLNYDAKRLKQRILIPTQEELKQLFLDGTTDICFDIQEIIDKSSRGSKILKWVFRIRSNEDEITEKDENEHFKLRIGGIITSFAPGNWKFIEPQIADFDKDTLFDLYERVVKFEEKDSKSPKINDPRAYLLYILREEFKINPNQQRELSNKIKEKTKKQVITDISTQQTLDFENLEKWDKFIEDLKRKISDKDYKTWFHPGIFDFYDYKKSNLTIKVASSFFPEKINKDFLPAVNSALLSSFGEVSLYFKINN